MGAGDSVTFWHILHFWVQWLDLLYGTIPMLVSLTFPSTPRGEMVKIHDPGKAGNILPGISFPFHTSEIIAFLKALCYGVARYAIRVAVPLRDMTKTNRRICSRLVSKK